MTFNETTSPGISRARAAIRNVRSMLEFNRPERGPQEWSDDELGSSTDIQSIVACVSQRFDSDRISCICRQRAESCRTVQYQKSAF